MMSTDCGSFSCRLLRFMVFMMNVYESKPPNFNICRLHYVIVFSSLALGERGTVGLDIWIKQIP